MDFGKCMGTLGGRLYVVWEVNGDLRGHFYVVWEVYRESRGSFICEVNVKGP